MKAATRAYVYPLSAGYGRRTVPGQGIAHYSPIRPMGCRPSPHKMTRADASEGMWSTDLAAWLVEPRANGVSNSEIAATFKLALGQAEHEIGKLIHAGVIASRHGLLWSHPDSYVQGCERTRVDVAANVGCRQTRATYAAYLKGEGFFNHLATEIGFSKAAVRKRQRKLNLPIERE